MSTKREEILGMVNWIQDLNNRLIPLIEEFKDMQEELGELNSFQLTDEERVGLPKSSKDLEDAVSSLYELSRLTRYNDGESLMREAEYFVDGLYLQLEHLYDYYEWYNEDGQIVFTLTYDAEVDAWKAVDHIADVGKMVDHIAGVGRMIEHADIRDEIDALETIYGFVSKIGNQIEEDGE